MDEAEAAIFESGGLLTSRCRDQIDQVRRFYVVSPHMSHHASQVFGIYDANHDGWMALPEATAWRSTSRDGFTALRVPELLRGTCYMECIQSQHTVSVLSTDEY